MLLHLQHAPIQELAWHAYRPNGQHMQLLAENSPPKDGISRNINPRELITGTKIDYNKHIRAKFDEYVQVHEEHNNTMQPRTTGAIATKPTGNVQGGHWFYSLTSDRMLDQRHWTPLPMPADVIARIEILAKASPAGMTFTNMRNEAYPASENRI
jgi:hypothetical protein